MSRNASLPEHLNDLHRARQWPKDIPMPKAGPFRLGARWTCEEEAELRRCYPLYGSHYAARLLGRSRKAVSIRALRIGIAGPSRVWTKKQIAVLKQKFGKMSREELARELGRSVSSMEVKARALGLARKPRPWSEKESEQLRALYRKVPVAEIGHRLGRTAGSVIGEVRRLGLARSLPPVTKAMQRTIMRKVGHVSMREIAAELGIGVHRVITIAKANGYKAEGQWWRNEFRPEEDAFIRKHYATMPIADIARHLGRLRIVIVKHARALGLPKEQSYHARAIAWSRQEDDLLRRLHPTMTMKEIAARLKRPVRGVTYRAYTLGLKRRPDGHRKWTAKEDAYIRKHYAGTSYNAIANNLGRSVNAVTGRVQMLGLTKQRPKVQRWTAKEDRLLRKLFGTISQVEIARRLNRRPGAVYARSGELGLSGTGKASAWRREKARRRVGT